MVLRYWGARGLDAESFASLVDRGAGGIRTNRLVEDLRRRGWNAVEVEGREDLVEAELGRGRPVLALIEDRPGTFHYIVIVAATPQAIVLHDPARTPFRVMEREQFARRWSRADRWMAVVTPIESSRSSEPPAPVAATEGSSCADLIASGVQRAQAGQFDEAERRLTSALSCGGAAPVRELAGLRLLQRRWLEVGELATAALAVDPMDEYAWQLLATSRFVQNDPEGALEAWNRIEQPRVDLVAVGGLTHTRQRVVERLLAVPSQALLTPRALRSERATFEGTALRHRHANRVRASFGRRRVARARCRTAIDSLRPMELCRARPGGGREKRSLVVDRRTHGWRRADQCGLAILAGPATRERRDRGTRALGRPVGRGWIRGAATLLRRRVSDDSPKRWRRRRIELDYFVGTSIGAPRSRRLGGSWEVRGRISRSSTRVSARSPDSRHRCVELDGRGLVRSGRGISPPALARRSSRACVHRSWRGCRRNGFDTCRSLVRRRHG